MNTEDVVYKKNSRKRYIFAVLLLAAIIALGYFVFDFLMAKVNSASVPDGYMFSLIEGYEGGDARMIYYVYDNQIWTEEIYGQNDKTVMVYEDIDTSELKLKDGDPNNCEKESCRAYAKTLKSIKKMLQNQIGKQHLSF